MNNATNPSKPLRIGIDGRFWYQTGVGRYIKCLANELGKIDKKNSYVLFVLKKDHSEIKKEIKHLNRIKIVPTSIEWHSFKEQILFPHTISHEQVSLMHFPYFSVPVFYKKPFVITIHDLILHHYPTGQASTLNPLAYKVKYIGYRYILRSAVKRASSIITVSQTTKNEIIKHMHVPKEKIHVTYEGVSPFLTKEMKNNQIPLENETYFLHVGNVYPHKNTDNLLTAYMHFKKNDRKNIKLVFVGRKDYFQELLVKKVHSLHIKDDVFFFTDVSDSMLSSFYKHAIALVAPSFMEGFGLPVLEALANSCLVLASNISSFREIAAGAAIYFNPHDVSSIADMLQFASLHTKKTFDKYIQVGQNRSKQFTWEKMAKETVNIYESCTRLRQSE